MQAHALLHLHALPEWRQDIVEICSGSASCSGIARPAARQWRPPRHGRQRARRNCCDKSPSFVAKIIADGRYVDAPAAWAMMVRVDVRAKPCWANRRTSLAQQALPRGWPRCPGPAGSFPTGGRMNHFGLFSSFVLQHKSNRVIDFFARPGDCMVACIGLTIRAKTLRQSLPAIAEGRPGAQRFRWWWRGAHHAVST